jgi:hypothetical protein
VNSVFGNLGTVGLALALTVLLIVGIPGGGKLKPLCDAPGEYVKVKA